MTRSWESIRDFYQDLALRPSMKALPIAGMLELVKAIEKSRYVTGLHGWTSMHTLCIVQMPVSHPYNGPRLTIAPLGSGKLEFRYIDTYIKEQQWHREVDPQDGFGRLELFLDQLHWFTQKSGQSSGPFRFRIEYVKASGSVIVIARSLGRVDFSIGENSTLGGCRLLKYLDQPRSIREDGTQDPIVFAFYLANEDDRKKLSVGAEVELVP